ncbi:MAG: HAMP domain-containing protein [Candidatus Omnitrophica bacterium]|nr:HAMP domain-containing protein [Candidatus Omnitrophota bacterium]
MKWGLRKKILLSMIALLMLLGLAIALITHTILLKVLKTEFQHKGISLSRSIAANSLVDVLTQNTLRLKKLVENEKSLDSSIAYVFIIDSSGQTLAHTFNQGFPVGLVKANNLEAAREFNIETLDTQLGFIYDIAAPIFLERSLVGQARIGILQNRIQRTINAINLVFMGITLLIMVIGILLAYKVSSLITRPISKLVKATQSIQKGDFSTRIDVQTKDEIGLLATAFNEMASHLSLMVEQAKQLTMLGERNRIALDLHDGDAQDLANIIKRLELCEKLFKIDPLKACAELSTLKQNTKDVLDRTRQVIYDLKSPEDNDFDLLHRLTAYIKDYEKKNNIKVKSDIPEATNHIPPVKAKAIFYIIREAFNNIRKHAQADNIELRLECNHNNELTVHIKDDGQGFDINEAELSASGFEKLGLVSMRQRATSLGGVLAINSVSKQGTEVSVNIPFKKKES